MKAILIVMLMTAVLCGCNKVVDPAPDEPQVPAEVMQVLEGAYADPQNMVFTEILDDQIWNVQLDAREAKYNSTLSPQQILVSYRLAQAEAPDSLKQLLNPGVIAGGTFSNFKEQEYTVFSENNYGKTYLADYSWKGAPYLLKWSATFLAGQKPTYTIEMEPITAQVPIMEWSDLPPALQDYMRSKGYILVRATISMQINSQKIYQVRLRKDNITFEQMFDQDCKLLAGSNQPQYFNNADEIPEQAKAYIASREEYQGFGFSGQFAGVIQYESDGVKSYQVSIQKHSGSISGTQVWYITFDQNGSPIYRKYLTLY